MESEPKIQSLLAEFPVIIVQPVQWGEQDALGHVNHVTYFRWAESARVAYSTRIGLMELHEAERIGPIMASVSNDYRRQVNYPDTVHVGVRVTRIGRSSLAMEHKIVSREGTIGRGGGLGNNRCLRLSDRSVASGARPNPPRHRESGGARLLTGLRVRQPIWHPLHSRIRAVARRHSARSASSLSVPSDIPTTDFFKM